MLRRTRTHLAEANETYLEHMRFAVGVGMMLTAAGIACIVHGLLPGFCTRTASRTVDELKRLFADRHALASVLQETSGALVLFGLVALTLPSWALLLMAPGYPVPMVTAAFALAIPFVYLCTNPQLDPV